LSVCMMLACADLRAHCSSQAHNLGRTVEAGPTLAVVGDSVGMSSLVQLEPLSDLVPRLEVLA
jgi:hypothetical protein